MKNYKYNIPFVVLFLFLFVFWDKVSLHRQVHPETPYIDQAGFQLK